MRLADATRDDVAASFGAGDLSWVMQVVEINRYGGAGAGRHPPYALGPPAALRATADAAILAAATPHPVPATPTACGGIDHGQRPPGRAGGRRAGRLGAGGVPAAVAGLPDDGRPQLPLPPRGVRLPPPDPGRRGPPAVPVPRRRLRRRRRDRRGAQGDADRAVPRDRPLPRRARPGGAGTGGARLPRDAGAPRLRRGPGRPTRTGGRRLDRAVAAPPPCPGETRRDARDPRHRRRPR